MWSILAEWCADAVAATSRVRRGAAARLYLALLATVAFGMLGLARSGPKGLLPLVVLGMLALALARDVFLAREQVWRAARLPLDDPRQEPPLPVADRLTGATSSTLHFLASAINSARRGRYAEAHDRTPMIQRDLLRPEEMRLLDGVRAMVSLGLGESKRAAQQAATALPTGSEEMDSALGRAIVSDAWESDERLAAIDASWHAAGVDREDQETLGRLRTLIRVRLDERTLVDVAPESARHLSDEARAIGDDELAFELEARGRASTYR